MKVEIERKDGTRIEDDVSHIGIDDFELYEHVSNSDGELIYRYEVFKDGISKFFDKVEGALDFCAKQKESHLN